MAYNVQFSPAAEREMKKLPANVASTVRQAINGLYEEPRPFRRARKLAGFDKRYRLRIGSHRVVYDVYDDRELVIIARILRRSETT